MAVNKLKKKIAKGRHRSALKRQRQTITRTERNRAARSALKTAVKKVRAARSPEALKTAIKVIDRTASRGIIPKRRASRLVSRLTHYVSAG